MAFDILNYLATINEFLIDLQNSLFIHFNFHSCFPSVGGEYIFQLIYSFLNIILNLFYSY